MGEGEGCGEVGQHLLPRSNLLETEKRYNGSLRSGTMSLADMMFDHGIEMGLSHVFCGLLVLAFVFLRVFQVSDLQKSLQVEYALLCNLSTKYVTFP